MNESYTQEYERFELHHWWFVARREVIVQFMDSAGANIQPDARWLDVGCGTGVLLHSQSHLQNKLGVELHAGSVAIARAKGLEVNQAEPTWNFRSFGQFDLITLCDVLEHVEHDRQAIEAVRLALADGGRVLVTVPALMSLWSEHDLVNHHFRRYTRPELLALFPNEQWEILRASYFSSLLLPAIWVARRLGKLRHKPASATGDLKFGPRWLDACLLAIFRCEKFLLSWFNLPLGSSLILVARKRPCPAL